MNEKSEYELYLEKIAINDGAIAAFVNKTLAPGERYSGYGMSKTWISYYVPRLKKNGEPGKILDWRTRDVTPLYQCEICEKISTPKKVSYRCCFGYDYLCMGCWNKLRPLEKKQQEVKELQKMINKLRKNSIKHRVKI